MVLLRSMAPKSFLVACLLTLRLRDLVLPGLAGMGRTKTWWRILLNSSLEYEHAGISVNADDTGQRAARTLAANCRTCEKLAMERILR